MKRIVPAFFLTAAVALAQTRVTFATPGRLPSEWQTGVTGHGVARWEIMPEDPAAPTRLVLKQSGEATFCWAVKTDVSLADGFAEVKFKPVSGREDQAGGIVFRFQDANNYYVVRGNALEDNVVAYKTVNGKRTSLPVKGRMFGYGFDAKIPAGRWSTLRVDFAGKLFAVSLNGATLFEVEDGAITAAGAVGVWTKADSITLFTDFSYGNKRP
jgi:hypothetical protein